MTALFNFLEFIIYIHTVHSFNKSKNVKIVLFICTEINSQSVYVQESQSNEFYLAIVFFFFC